MSDKSRVQGRWATFGKISAIVILLCTVAVTVIAIYTFASGKPVLEVVVSSSVFRTPPEVKSEGKSSYREWSDGFYGYFVIIVSNKGEAQADNVVIDFPYSGVAELLSEDENRVELAFRDSIKLGSIRPKKGKTVHA